MFGSDLHQKDPRVLGRGFLAGLEHLTASISSGPQRPRPRLRCGGYKEVCDYSSHVYFPLGYRFPFACSEAFRFLNSLPKSNHEMWGNFA